MSSPAPSPMRLIRRIISLPAWAVGMALVDRDAYPHETPAVSLAHLQAVGAVPWWDCDLAAAVKRLLNAGDRLCVQVEGEAGMDVAVGGDGVFCVVI